MGPQLGATGSVNGVARPELGCQPGCSLHVAAAAEPPPGQVLATPWPYRLWSMGRWGFASWRAFYSASEGPARTCIWWRTGQWADSDFTIAAPGVRPGCVTLGELLNLSGSSVPHLWKRG